MKKEGKTNTLKSIKSVEELPPIPPPIEREKIKSIKNKARTIKKKIKKPRINRKEGVRKKIIKV